MLAGRDGWLFLRNDTNDYIGQLTGRRPLTAEQVSGWRILLEARAEVVRELGIAWVSVIAPEKHVVYAEYLPDGLTPAARRPVHQFAELAHEAGAPACYPIDELAIAKRNAQLYPRVDTHWNQRGAYIAYHRIGKAIASRGLDVEILPESAIRWHEREEAGDLGGKLPSVVTGGVATAHLVEHSARIVFDNQVIHHGSVIAFESDRADAPRAVVVGESYTNHLLVFLKETFSRTLFVHSSALDRRLLEAERPDVVITVPTERFLVRLPTDDGARDRIERTAQDKRRRGKMRAAAFFDRYLAGVPVAAGARRPETIGVIPW